MITQWQNQLQVCTHGETIICCVYSHTFGIMHVDLVLYTAKYIYNMIADVL